MRGDDFVALARARARVPAREMRVEASTVTALGLARLGNRLTTIVVRAWPGRIEDIRRRAGERRGTAGRYRGDEPATVLSIKSHRQAKRVRGRLYRRGRARGNGVGYKIERGRVTVRKVSVFHRPPRPRPADVVSTRPAFERDRGS